jgi:hypothetical protein
MSINNLKDLSGAGQLLIDLGEQPVSNRFLNIGKKSEAPCFPLQLRIDKSTGLVFQGNPFPIDELKPHYEWLTCFEPEMHLDDMVSKMIGLPGVTKNTVFGGYSFKDDSTLRRLENLGYKNTWRLDPATDLGVTDPCANVETYQAVLTEEKAKWIAKHKGLADVLIVRHVVEHSYNLPEFIASMRALTNPDGYIVWELPDCERAFVSGDFTTIWEEHTFYFTTHTFHKTLTDSDFEVVHFESVPYPFENSIVAIVKSGQKKQETATDEKELIYQVTLAENFAALIELRRIAVRAKLVYLKEKYGLIALFGAGHLSVAFLSLMNVKDLVDFVIDDNPNKKGMLMPIGNLEIKGSESLYDENVKICLLSLNPQNQPKVIVNHKPFTDQGGIFASIFPGGEMDLFNTL